MDKQGAGQHVLDDEVLITIGCSSVAVRVELDYIDGLRSDDGSRRTGGVRWSEHRWDVAREAQTRWLIRDRRPHSSSNGEEEEEEEEEDKELHLLLLEVG